MALERLRASYTKQAAIAGRVAARDREVSTLEKVFAAVLGIETSAANTALAAFTVRAFNRWLDRFYPSHEALVAERLAGEVEDYGARLVGYALEEIDAVDVPVDVPKFAGGFTAGAASRWSRSSVAQLRLLASESEPVEQITDRLAGWGLSRSGEVAAAEATRALGAFTKLAYLTGGANAWRWVARGSSCPLCKRMNGRVVSIVDSEPFLDEGGLVIADGADGPIELETRTRIGHPPLHEGHRGVCDCYVVAS